MRTEDIQEGMQIEIMHPSGDFSPDTPGSAWIDRVEMRSEGNETWVHLEPILTDGAGVQLPRGSSRRRIPAGISFVAKYYQIRIRTQAEAALDDESRPELPYREGMA